MSSAPGGHGSSGGGAHHLAPRRAADVGAAGSGPDHRAADHGPADDLAEADPPPETGPWSRVPEPPSSVPATLSWSPATPSTEVEPAHAATGSRDVPAPAPSPAAPAQSANGTGGEGQSLVALDRAMARAIAHQMAETLSRYVTPPLVPLVLEEMARVLGGDAVQVVDVRDPDRRGSSEGP